MMVRRLAMLALAATWVCAASAQETASPQECVNLLHVDSTYVVDDQAILFYMKNGEVLMNSLPSKCPTLKSEDRFMYRVRMNQLCRLDTVTVIYNAGFGLTEGPTCPIGDFQPVSADFASKLRAPKGARAAPAEE